MPRLPGREYYPSGRIKPVSGKLEYQKRIARGEARGISRTEARGHITVRSLNYYIEQTIPKRMDPNEYRAAIDAAIHNNGTSESQLRAYKVHFIKQAKIQKDYEALIASGATYEQAGDESGGTEFWNDKQDWEPPEMYMYHP